MRREGDGGRYPKVHPFQYVRYVSCMPVSKWKVSNHARVKLTCARCAVLHLKGMALNHLVITQLQQLLENSSIADVHEASRSPSVYIQTREISLPPIRCFAE